MSDTNKNDLIVEIKKYLNEITKINDYLSVYSEIIRYINDKEYIDIINLSPAFFTINLLSLKSNIIMSLARLFDDDGQAKSLKKLINRCRNNYKIFSTKRIESFINEDDPEKSETYYTEICLQEIFDKFLNEWYAILESNALQNIKILRNKIYAHNDKKYFLKPQMVPKIPFDDINYLIGYSEKVCNRLLELLNNEVMATKSTNVNDLSNIIEKVKLCERLK